LPQSCRRVAGTPITVTPQRFAPLRRSVENVRDRRRSCRSTRARNPCHRVDAELTESYRRVAVTLDGGSQRPCQPGFCASTLRTFSSAPVRQRPIESGGYEDNSVAAGTPGIDESVPPENRGAIPAEPYVTTGFRPAAGPLEPDPEADRATDPSSGSAAYRPPVVPPTLGSGPGLPEQAAYQRALVNSASFVLLHD
jgi:hypothetical protein